MSVTVSTAGISFLGLKSLHNLTNRLSGTSTLETLGSIVPVDYFFCLFRLTKDMNPEILFQKKTRYLQKGKFSAGTLCLQSRLKNELLPTLGKPTIPIVTLFLGLPRNVTFELSLPPFFFPIFYFFIYHVCVCRSRSQLHKNRKKN